MPETSARLGAAATTGVAAIQRSIANDAFIIDMVRTQLGLNLIIGNAKAQTSAPGAALTSAYVWGKSVWCGSLEGADMAAGTGGAPKTFNVSTLAAVVAAAAGAKVAKHGNRSRTGRGSAEVMEVLGINVNATPAQQARCLDETGICFCFAIHHHPAARHVMPVRKALGFPTIFNLLGPLTNPAGAGRQVMGVYAGHFVRPIAESLLRLGSTHAMVLHSDDGLDEISIAAPTRVVEVRDGKTREWTIDPRALGLERADSVALAPHSLEEAASIFINVLSGEERGPRRAMVLVNAAAALMVAGVVKSIEDGIGAAADAIDFGRGLATLEGLRATSNAQ